MTSLLPPDRRLVARSRLRMGLARCLSLAALLAVGALVALPPVEAEAQGKSRKQKSYDFEDDVIETQFLRPDVATTEGVKKDKRRSLIRIRKDFFAELIRSAEDL